MVGGPGSGLARSIQTLYDVGSTAGMDDEALLSRYLDGGEGARVAFEAIVARHGATVLQVCRAVAGSTADADDAFQAVFLVLACRAASVRRRKSLGSWLFGVARRTALRARKQAARRREQERKAAALATTTVSEPPADDAVAVLIEEVDRLPPRYRDPVVLCHLQGLGYEAAAARLGCPTSTLGVRLKRARERLRVRLERRGISPTIALPAASVPNALADATSRLALLVGPSLRGGVPVAVLTLTRGALRTMKITKAFAASAVFSTAFLVMAVGAWAWHESAANRIAPRVDPPPPARALPPGEYRMTGRVADPETGEGVAGARIRVFEAEYGGKVAAETVSGPDGTYSLSLPVGNVGAREFTPPPGYYRVSATVDLYPKRVTDARPEWVQDFVTIRGEDWGFRVVWAADGRPAPKVNLWGVRGAAGAYDYGAVTDDEGRARLPLPKRPVRVNNAETPEVARLMAIPRETRETASVQGLFAEVRWDDDFNPDDVRDVSRLDGDGVRYRITDRDGRTATMTELMGGARFKPEIEAGRLVVDLALPAPPPGEPVEVVGGVVDPRGNPIAGATVELWYGWRHQGGGHESRARSEGSRGMTDEEGRYRLVNVPSTAMGEPAMYVTIRASRPGFSWNQRGETWIPARGPVKVRDMVLEPAECSAVGRVVGLDGKPLAGAAVVTDAFVDPSLARSTRTDAEGRFRLDGLREGSVGFKILYGDALHLTKPWFATASRDPEPVVFQVDPDPPFPQNP